MKFTQPQIESPITREQLESLGLHYTTDWHGGIQSFSDVPPTEQLSRAAMFRLDLYSNGYISFQVLAGLAIAMQVNGYFRNIQHFVDTCKGLGVEF